MDSYIKTTVLLSSSCHNKIPQTRWLKQQIFIFSRFWRLEVSDQGADQFCSWWGLFSWLAVSYLSALSSNKLNSVHAKNGWSCWEEDLSFSSYRASSYFRLGHPPYDLFHLNELLFPNTVTLEIKTSLCGFWGHDMVCSTVIFNVALRKGETQLHHHTGQKNILLFFLHFPFLL